MDLTTERMSYAGQPRPKVGSGFGGILENGFYINYLHGLDYLCRKYVGKNTKVLELGSFYGSSAELFCEYTNELTCVDIVLYPEMNNVIQKNNITFVQSDSIEYLKNIDSNKYDLIYIDTTHDFGRTKEELLLSYSKLSDGAFIAGHDYNIHGVWEAILHVFEYPDIEVYLDSSWIIQKNNRLKLKS